MPQFRNTSPDTVVDALTGRVAGPDEVIDVPDDLVELYNAHSIWAPVGSLGAPPAPEPVAEPTPPTPAADAAGITSQEA